MTEKCPVCEKGKMRPGRIREEMFGVKLGTYPGRLCDHCAETFVDSKTMRRIEARAKKLGIWGLGKKVAIARSGNSLVVRIPANLVGFLRLKGGEEAFVRPEGRGRIVVDLG